MLSEVQKTSRLGVLKKTDQRQVHPLMNLDQHIQPRSRIALSGLDIQASEASVELSKLSLSMGQCLT